MNIGVFASFLESISEIFLVRRRLSHFTTGISTWSCRRQKCAVVAGFLDGVHAIGSG